MTLGISNCVVCGSEIATCLIMQLEVCQKCGFDLLAPSGEEALMLNRILAKMILMLFNVYVNRQLKAVQTQGGVIMKGKFVLKGLEMSFSCFDKVPTFNEAGQQSGVDMKEMARGSFTIDESSQEVEMEQEEFKHLHTTIKEDLADMRTNYLMPLMEKVFTVADNLTIIADKKVESGIKIAEHVAGIKSGETPS